MANVNLWVAFTTEPASNADLRDVVQLSGRAPRDFTGTRVRSSRLNAEVTP